MTVQAAGFRQFLLVLVVLLFNSASLPASEWRTVALPARALNIEENNGSLWICGADELIAVPADGGKNWTTKHNVANGRLLPSLGFADKRFGYAAGTGGAILVSTDSGDTWTAVKVPSQIVYQASFSDPKHGIIETLLAAVASGGIGVGESRGCADPAECRGRVIIDLSITPGPSA